LPELSDRLTKLVILWCTTFKQPAIDRGGIMTL